jgi:hypothetical protein
MNSQRGKASTNASKRSSTAATKTNGSSAPRRKRKQQKKASQGSGFNIAASVAYSAMQTSTTASITSSARSVRIVHREQFSENAGDIGFNAFSVRINPGKANVFPWMSQMARSWTKYRFHKLCFTYYPRCPTTTAGSLALALDYNAIRPLPDSSAELSTFDGAVEDSCWKSMRIVADCRQFEADGYYIRGNLTPLGTDPKTYDCGQLFVGSSSAAADGTAFGKLWVEYDVELYEARPDDRLSIGHIQAVASATVPMSASQVFPATGTERDVSYVDVGDSGLQIFVSTSNNVQVSGFNIGSVYELSMLVGGTTVTQCTISTIFPVPNGLGVVGNLFNAGNTYGSGWATFTPTAHTHVFTIACTAATVTGAHFTVHSREDV